MKFSESRGETENLIKKFDKKSLSYYLLDSSDMEWIPLNYEIDPDFNYKDIYEYASKHGTLIRMSDVTGISWKQNGNEFSGGFKVSTSYGFKARCLFQGESSKITKMVFARKDSDKFEDGYAVFGCDYGKNPLVEHARGYGARIRLPYCDNAEVITKKDPKAIFIEIDKKNNICISRTYISVEVLMSILKKSMSEYGNDVPVFLFVDEMADDKIEVVVAKIKELGLEPYRVYFDSKNKGRFVCVAKKL